MPTHLLASERTLIPANEKSSPITSIKKGSSSSPRLDYIFAKDRRNFIEIEVFIKKLREFQFKHKLTVLFILKNINDCLTNFQLYFDIEVRRPCYHGT